MADGGAIHATETREWGMEGGVAILGGQQVGGVEGCEGAACRQHL